MLKSLTLGMILAGLSFGLSAQPAAPQHTHEHAQPHQHETHAGNAPIAVPTERWATDAPLRKGMQQVHDALAVLDHYPMGHVSEAMALDRVKAIKDAGAYMFANCKLPEKPDEALHGMLVPLLAAAQKLEQDPADMTQVKAMQDAVADYPRYFDDPNQPAAEGPDTE